MRTAIYGLSKTGTSALFALLRAAMPANTDCYFEPGERHRGQLRRRRLRQWLGPGRALPLLVKFLPFATHPRHRTFDFGPFDHSILVVRDPRDRLVSHLLYSVYDSSVAERPDDAADFIRMLEQKEQSPASIGLLEILRAATLLMGHEFDLDRWLENYRCTSIDAPLRFADDHSETIDVRYEDLVDGELADLSRRTGLDLSGPVDVGPELQRVIRTKRYGNWRDWFTSTDVAVLKPVFQPYLGRYYPDADWAINSEPAISPDQSSDYVRRILAERRMLRGVEERQGSGRSDRSQ